MSQATIQDQSATRGRVSTGVSHTAGKDLWAAIAAASVPSDLPISSERPSMVSSSGSWTASW